MTRLLAVELRADADLVRARQRAKQLAIELGFDTQDQARIATAVSEIARNAHRYARDGRVEFHYDAQANELFVRVQDQGPGIAQLDEVLAGRYQSSTGMGMGIVGARRLMDRFEIRSEPDEGTTVELAKRLPARALAPEPARLAEITSRLALEDPGDAVAAVEQQNAELLRVLDELRRRRGELNQLNRELEETNRGVVALYAELDEKAAFLQRANEIKTRFLSNMTHEFRTPLNSVISLARILLQRIDGELTAEQEKQIKFIERAALDLSELVNDLLDLAKVEAGKITARAEEFRVADSFSALRGMLRPLLGSNPNVELIFEEVSQLPPLYTDESKLSQILRNFISNAIKYTERGEVRVRAEQLEDGRLRFCVADTGIGIAPEDQERVFEEFAQVESPLQQRSKGTGLGLPLSRRLAELLGGQVGVESEPGQGSTFCLTIPPRLPGEGMPEQLPQVPQRLDPNRLPVLVVDDDRDSLVLVERLLRDSPYQLLPAPGVEAAQQLLRQHRPAVIVLDVMLQHEASWELLDRLKRDPDTRDIPVVVLTALENEAHARELGADAFHLKPAQRGWLLDTLRRLTAERRRRRPVLIIDDDEISRYLLKGLLDELNCPSQEAGDAFEGLQILRGEPPAAIFLDVMMPGRDGFAVYDELQKDPAMREIPLIIYTAKRLSDRDRSRLARALAVVPKQSATRDEALRQVGAALERAGVIDPAGGAGRG